MHCVLHLRVFLQFADNSRGCRRIPINCLVSGISLTNYGLILVLIWISTQIQECLRIFWPLWNIGNCENFAGSAALAEVCGLSSASSLVFDCTVVDFYLLSVEPAALHTDLLYLATGIQSLDE